MLGGDAVPREAFQAARDLGCDGRQRDFALEATGTTQRQLALLAQLGVFLRGQIRQIQSSPYEQEEVLGPDGRPGHDRVEDVESRDTAKDQLMVGPSSHSHSSCKKGKSGLPRRALNTSRRVLGR